MTIIPIYIASVPCYDENHSHLLGGAMKSLALHIAVAALLLWAALPAAIR